MFVEYMALKDKKEAQTFFDASANLKPAEKDELYIVKEKDEYHAVLKIKKFRKKYSEQKWILHLNDKGIKANRERTTAYILELLVTIISAILSGVLTTMAFVLQDKMAVFLWLSLVGLFVFLFVSWRKLFKPSVSLKIFLIRIL